MVFPLCRFWIVDALTFFPILSELVSRLEHKNVLLQHFTCLSVVDFGNKLNHMQMSFSVVNKVFITFEREDLN